jgi:hypothetical protein
MWRVAALALLLCASCENSDFYRQDTHSWFGPYATPPASPAAAPASPAAPAAGANTQR